MSKKTKSTIGIGCRVCIAPKFDGAGRAGRVIGPAALIDGILWMPVVWDDEKDPNWHKGFGLVAEVVAVKSLAQIAYEARDGLGNFGEWGHIPTDVRRSYESIAAAVEKAVLERLKK